MTLHSKVWRTFSGGVAIRWGIRVGDADIEDRRGASGPEAVDSDVAAEFWGGLGAVGARRLHVLTRSDEGSSETVEGVRLPQLSPRRHEVVVAVEDQAAFATGHGVLRREAFAASVASGRERCGGRPKRRRTPSRNSSAERSEPLRRLGRVESQALSPPTVRCVASPGSRAREDRVQAARVNATDSPSPRGDLWKRHACAP
ncbi:hypothetical protein MHU86_21399 [Fragilaria crotonensis]|nr:hypothetical protein MHU86_21399 [Fragilaria crotonensis]